MADRNLALRAVARQLAAERADPPAPRPASARIPLPVGHAADLAAGRTHRLRLTAPAIDADRLAAALDAAAATHEALRLGPVRDSGRWFLAAVEHPVVRVGSAEQLDRADPNHPLRWALEAGPGRVTATLAVSAYLIDRAGWGDVLSTVDAAYRGEPVPAPRLGYGDYCWWLAHRADRGPGGREPGQPAAELYWAFAAGLPWAVDSRPMPPREGPRAATVDRLATDLAAALRSCGWRSPEVRIRRHRPRLPVTAIVGRADEPVVGPVRVDGREPVVGTGGPEPAADPGSVGAGSPVHADVDVVDLPRLRFDGVPVVVEPVLEPTPGWQCVLVRQPDGTRLHAAGAGPTLSALLAALTPTAARTPAAASASADFAGVTEPTSAGAEAVPLPGLVTPRRALPAGVVAAAVERRAAELRDAGARPGGPVVLDLTADPETVANLLAALHCRADVLLLDPADPAPWRAGLLDRLPGAVTVGADNRVRPASGPAPEPAGDEGALLLGLSSAPGTPVLGRVPLPDLLRGAAALAALWDLAEDGAAAVDAARGGEDLVLTVLACGLRGADVLLPGDDDAEAVELLGQVPGSWVDLSLVRDMTVPLHQLSGTRWCRRATGPYLGTDVLGRWWVAEAPAAQWRAADGGLTAPGGSARLADNAGRSMPDGTIGELAVRVGPGSRYIGDPRRTADRMRPAFSGTRELRTGALAGRLGPALRLLRLPADRAVDGNRTCLTDAWTALAPDGVVGVAPPDEAAAERPYVLSPGPVDPVELPRPLAAATLRVDPDAAGLDPDAAWLAVRQRPEAPAAAGEQVWATPEEEMLAREIVAPVLGRSVGRADALFSIGATSLQLMRILLQVKEQLGVAVPLARFFATPTVAVLAELITDPADRAAAVLDVLDQIEGET